MVDVFSAAKRSQIMRRVRSERTKPEEIVVEIVRRLRFRPRRNDSSVVGTPDLVFPRRRKAIFVHGCFWHRHACPDGRSTPATRVEFWQAKFDRNRRRDARVGRELRKAGWRLLVVWECQTRASVRERLTRRIQLFLRDERR